MGTRLRRRLAPVAVIFFLAGCLGPEVTDDGESAWDRLARSGGPRGADAVAVEYAVLERPAGDPYFDEQIWRGTDEQIVPWGVRARLNANGLRAGLVAGIPPPKLQRLLTSEDSCVRSRRMQTRAGRPFTVPLNGPLDACRVRWHRMPGKGAEPEELIACKLGVRVAARPDGDDAVRLTVTPHLEHGEGRYLLKRGDARVWSLQGQRPGDSVKELAVEVRLPVNDYLILGTESSRAGTLGHRTLVSTMGPNPVQRLLLIRAWGPGRAEKPRPAGGHAIALQAAGTAARGTSPR